MDDIINYLSNKNIDKELKQSILKSYPEIKKIVGEKNIDSFLNGTIPFPPDVRNAIAKRINPNAELLQVPSDVPILNQPIANAKSKLKNIDKTKFNEAIAGNLSGKDITPEEYAINIINNNPNLSLEEKQNILAEYPELIKRIGAEKVNEYLKNNVPLPYIPPAPDDALAAVPDLTSASGILNYLSNPNIPEVNKKIVLKNYPEIEQIVKQQGGDINDYLNNKRISKFIILGVLGIALLALSSYQLVAVRGNLDNLLDDNGRFLTYKTGIEIWTQSIGNFLFGAGFEDSIWLKGGGV